MRRNIDRILTKVMRTDTDLDGWLRAKKHRRKIIKCATISRPIWWEFTSRSWYSQFIPNEKFRLSRYRVELGGERESDNNSQSERNRTLTDFIKCEHPLNIIKWTHSSPIATSVYDVTISSSTSRRLKVVCYLLPLSVLSADEAEITDNSAAAFTIVWLASFGLEKKATTRPPFHQVDDGPGQATPLANALPLIR